LHYKGGTALQEDLVVAMGAVESSFEQIEAEVMNTLTGAVVEALTVPDYLQSATLLALQGSDNGGGGGGGRGGADMDDPMRVLLELKVVEHALFALLAQSRGAAADPDLRWVFLRSPNEFKAPKVEEARGGGVRVVVVATHEARWVAIDCGTPADAERALASTGWADWDMRRGRRGGGDGGGPGGPGSDHDSSDSSDESGDSDEGEDARQRQRRQREAAAAAAGKGASSYSSAAHSGGGSGVVDRSGRLVAVHRGCRDLAERAWGLLLPHVEEAEADFSAAEAVRALHTQKLVSPFACLLQLSADGELSR